MPAKNFKDTIKVNKSMQQQHMESVVMQTLDKYLMQNDFDAREYFSYLTCAIYLVYKKLYPDLAIYIPFRIKSDNSTMRNVHKEVIRDLENIDFSNLNETEEMDALKENFTLEGIIKDFMGATIVLDHRKDYRKNGKKYESPEIQELLDKEKETTKFIGDCEELIEEGFIDEEKYLSLKIDILAKIIENTYSEFTEERTIPFSTELENLKNIFDKKSQTGNFATTITKAEYDELINLIDELRSRKSDKLEFEILQETFPKVFNDPLIKNALGATIEFNKFSKKSNGFASLYYTVTTPFGIMEFQLQSNKRYYEAKKGSAFHSGIKGKTINIDSFFELADPNDEKPLQFYLNALDSFPADKIISSVELPSFKTPEEKKEFLRTEFGQEYLASEKIKEYMKHIKIKDNMIFKPDTTVKESVNGELVEKPAQNIDYTNLKKPDEIYEQKETIMDTNEYLLSLALSLSPYMNVCHSAHTLFSSANTQAKSVEDEFSEILRKKDSLSALRNMLVERLKTILKTTDNKVYQKVLESTSLLPNDVSRSDIIDYSKRLHEKKHNEFSNNDNIER